MIQGATSTCWLAPSVVLHASNHFHSACLLVVFCNLGWSKHKQGQCLKALQGDQLPQAWIRNMKGYSSELQVSSKFCHPSSFGAANTTTVEGINKGLIISPGAAITITAVEGINRGSFPSGRDIDMSSSPPSKGSPWVGQQTVVNLQCAHFECTMQQIQQDKKTDTTTTTTSSKAAATAYRTELSTLQDVKKTQSRRESFDLANSPCTWLWVEMISGFHRLKVM